MSHSSTPISSGKRELENSPMVHMGYTCDMGVLEHDQETIAEGAAGRLSSSKEEIEHRHHEVLMMELRVAI